jgi:hypothetical protein
MLHPTRLSVDERCDPIQAAPGYRKLVERYTSQVCVCERSRERLPCGGVEGARWLHSPPHARASPVTGHAEPDRSRGRGWDRGPVSQARRSIERGNRSCRVCSNVPLYVPPLL